MSFPSLNPLPMKPSYWSLNGAKSVWNNALCRRSTPKHGKRNHHDSVMDLVLMLPERSVCPCNSPADWQKSTLSIQLMTPRSRSEAKIATLKAIAINHLDANFDTLKNAKIFGVHSVSTTLTLKETSINEDAIFFYKEVRMVQVPISYDNCKYETWSWIWTYGRNGSVHQKFQGIRKYQKFFWTSIL
jgi:hypothetical protein